jgi:hypothetical protein
VRTDENITYYTFLIPENGYKQNVSPKEDAAKLYY